MLGLGLLSGESSSRNLAPPGRLTQIVISPTLLVTTGTQGFWSRTRLAMPKTIYAPDSSSLKPGSGVTEGVLD